MTYQNENLDNEVVDEETIDTVQTETLTEDDPEEKNIDLDNLVIKVYGASNIGKVRKENQDSFYLDGKYLHKFLQDDEYILEIDATEPQLYAVFDGLGGEEGGEISSKIACETMADFQEELTHCKLSELYDKFCDYATLANRKICKALHSYLYPRGGTTLAAIQISNGAMHPFYLGDSRIYMGFGDELYLMSEDHTVAGAKVRAGKMTEEEAMRSNENHMLTNFLGDQPGAKRVEVAANTGVKLQPGLYVLLCSDGLHDYVPIPLIYNVLLNSKNPAHDLVELALSVGGYDNVTPVVLRVCEKE